MDFPTAVLLAAMSASFLQIPPEPKNNTVLWITGPVCRSPVILEQVLLRVVEIGRIPAVVEHNTISPPGFCVTSPDEKASLGVQVFENRPRPSILIIRGEPHALYRVNVVARPRVTPWGVTAPLPMRPEYGYIALRATYSLSPANLAQTKP